MKSCYIVSGIIQKDDAIALGRKANGRGPYPDTWNLPGGGVKDAQRAAALFQRTDYDNAYLHEELQREIREGLGVEVANIRCVAPTDITEPDEAKTSDKHGELTHYYFLVYLCDYARGELTAGDDLAEALWVPRGKLATYPLNPPSQKLFHELGWLTYRNPDGSVTSPLDNLPLWPLISAVAWQTAGPILILGIGGALLDRRLHTGPLLMLLGVILSFAVSWVLVRSTVRRWQHHVQPHTKESLKQRND
jgi:ADP-ribose pyrophosphatase YjhB (NUDIX family)